MSQENFNGSPDLYSTTGAYRGHGAEPCEDFPWTELLAKMDGEQERREGELDQEAKRAGSEFLNALIFWLVTGASRSDDATKQKRKVTKGIANPDAAGARLIAMVYCLRPDIIENRTMAELSRARGGSGNKGTVGRVVSDLLDRFPILRGVLNKNSAKRVARRARE